MSILTWQNLRNLHNLHPHELKRLFKRVKAIMKSPLLYEDDISFLRLEMAVCRRDLYWNRQVLANLEFLMKRAAGTVFSYLSAFPADDVFVTAYKTFQQKIDKDRQLLLRDERELETWFLRTELEKDLPAFMAAWKAEKQRRYGSSFGSDVELGFDALDALETYEPDDFELIDVVDVEAEADGWQLVF